jgi:tRNA 2-thiocytidine biosynthesis protein TtcA
MVKRLVADLDRENPKVRNNLFAALSNVRPTHLLDRELTAALAGRSDSDAAPQPSIGARRLRVL